MGGSKKQTIGYRYNLAMHMILCHGPIDYISKIVVGEKTVWTGISNGGEISIFQSDIFGGDEKEGGISGSLDLDMGEPTQPKNSFLTSLLGPIIPAYRKVVGVVLKDMYLGTTPYLKPWSFVGTRILKTSDGEDQWYPEKASISKGEEVVPDPIEFDLDSVFPNISFGPLGDYPATMTIGPFSDFREIRAGVGGARADDRFVFNDVVYGTVDNEEYDYGHLFRVMSPGEIVTVKIRNVAPFQHFGTGKLEAVAIARPQPDMNPVHIIRECLTNTDWGMGYPSTDIDDLNFAQVADTLYDEGLGISIVWDRSMDIYNFVEEILRHIDCSLFVSRTTGKFNLKLIREDFDIEDLIVLDKSNISSISNPNRVAFGELSNSVTVKFWNYETEKDDSVTITDTALAQIQQGILIDAPVNYPGFTTKRNAIIAAQRDLRALSSGFFSCTIICDRSAEDLNLGSPFVLNWPEFEIENMVMRVTGISFGDGINNKIRLTCSEDIYSTPTVPVISDVSGSWIDPNQFPQKIENQIAIEAPYFEAVQNYGQVSVDSELESNPDIGYALVSASRPFSEINARLWTDDGSGYVESKVIDFCPFGITTSELSPNQTSVILEEFKSLSSVEVGTYAQIGSGDNAEFIRIDSINSGTGEITFGRGCLDTTPKRHLIGSEVFFIDLFASPDETEHVSGETVDVKLTAISGSGQYNLASADPLEVTFSSRAYRPYAPGQFQINSQYYPEGTLSGVLTFTWVGRDRTQQTSEEIYDHLEGNIGPEVGTEYRLRGYINGVLAHTAEPVTSGVTWTPTEGIVKVEIHSKRDGYYSFQAATHEFQYSVNNSRASEDGLTRVSEQSEEIRFTEN